MARDAKNKVLLLGLNGRAIMRRLERDGHFCNSESLPRPCGLRGAPFPQIEWRREDSGGLASCASWCVHPRVTYCAEMHSSFAVMEVEFFPLIEAHRPIGPLYSEPTCLNAGNAQNSVNRANRRKAPLESPSIVRAYNFSSIGLLCICTEYVECLGRIFAPREARCNWRLKSWEGGRTLSHPGCHPPLKSLVDFGSLSSLPSLSL